MFAVDISIYVFFEVKKVLLFYLFFYFFVCQSFFPLKARGLSNNVKRKAFFLIAKQEILILAFFKGPHSLAKDANFWKTQYILPWETPFF